MQSSFSVEMAALFDSRFDANGWLAGWLSSTT